MFSASNFYLQYWFVLWILSFIIIKKKQKKWNIVFTFFKDLFRHQNPCFKLNIKTIFTLFVYVVASEMLFQ